MIASSGDAAVPVVTPYFLLLVVDSVLVSPVACWNCQIISVVADAAVLVPSIG